MVLLLLKPRISQLEDLDIAVFTMSKGIILDMDFAMFHHKLIIQTANGSWWNSQQHQWAHGGYLCLLPCWSLCRISFKSPIIFDAFSVTDIHVMCFFSKRYVHIFQTTMWGGYPKMGLPQNGWMVYKGTSYSNG